MFNTKEEFIKTKKILLDEKEICGKGREIQIDMNGLGRLLFLYQDSITVLPDRRALH